jgi:winged helix-turn helix protein
MSKPLVVRPLTDEERCTLETGLRSSDAFTLRRCQILLASADGGTSGTISRQLRCGQQTVRNVIRAFNARGLAVLTKGSTVAHHLPHTAFDAAGLEQLKVIIKRSPRTFARSAAKPFGPRSSAWISPGSAPSARSQAPIQTTPPKKAS